MWSCWIFGHRARSRVLRSEEWQKSAIFILPGVLTNAAAMDIWCAAVDCSSIERITMHFLLLIIPLKLLFLVIILQHIFGGWNSSGSCNSQTPVTYLIVWAGILMPYAPGARSLPSRINLSTTFFNQWLMWILMYAIMIIEIEWMQVNQSHNKT